MAKIEPIPGRPRAVRIITLGALLGVAALFATSLVYRLEHPGMQKQVHSTAQAAAPGESGQPPAGMPGGAGGGMDMESVRQMIAGLEARLADDPGDLEALMQLADIQLMRNDLAKAKTYLDQAAAHAGDDKAVLHQLSAAYFRMQDNQAAADLLQRIIALDPGDGYARFNLGVVYAYRLDNPDAAAEQFRAVLALPETGDLQDKAREELQALGQKP